MQNVAVTAGLTFAFGGKTPKPAPKPEPTPAPAPAPVKIILEDIHFDFDKAILCSWS